MIDNGMQDWLLAVSPKTALGIIIELLVCAIHPIPGDINLKWKSHDFPVLVPLDIVLSIPMFLRFYLLCRLVRPCAIYTNVSRVVHMFFCSSKVFKVLFIWL